VTRFKLSEGGEEKSKKREKEGSMVGQGGKRGPGGGWFPNLLPFHPGKKEGKQSWGSKKKEG